MKRKITMLLAAALIFALTGCSGMKHSYEINITIPAGRTESFVYSDEEISPIRDTIVIWSGDNLPDTEVVLKTVEVREENAYEPTYITPGMPVRMDVERGAWFKIGVAVQNPTDEDITVSVTVENIDVRITCE